MKIGTKSVLYGAHCFFIHPFFVALAWFKLYGFKSVKDWHAGRVSIFSFKLWVAFFVHDLGYWRKPNMDGEEGEEHPLWGAQFMERCFSSKNWHNFVLYHSRYYSKNTIHATACYALRISSPLPLSRGGFI